MSEEELDKLGKPDEMHTFEKDGVTYLERIWCHDDGGEYKQLNIMDEDGNILEPKTMSMTSENISDEDLNEMFKFRNSLPLNFLNALSKGADEYNRRFMIQPIIGRRRSMRVETLDEKLDRLEEEKMEAVRNQEYEKAAGIRNEQDDLRRNNKDVL